MRASRITHHSPRQSPYLHVDFHGVAEDFLDGATLLKRKHFQPLPTILSQAQRHAWQLAVGAVRPDSAGRRELPNSFWRRGLHSGGERQSR